MSTTPSSKIARYADKYLQIGGIDDWPNALNGLQIQNSGSVTKFGAAVDASTRALAAAAERGINFLVVHHGLFWSGLQPVTAAFHRQLRIAFDADLALYAAHLPLDLHPVVGNNAQIAAALGLQNTEPFFATKGQLIGVKSTAVLPMKELVRRLDDSLGRKATVFSHGPDETRTIGVVSGAAASEIYAVARDGIDTFITGEAPHWAAIAAEELKMNLILGGHYATETFGVKAFAAHLSERFGLPWEFIDQPTGL